MTRKREHGMWNTKEYRAWNHMIARCHRPNCQSYKHYGARGIKVCSKWRDFKEFYKEVGSAPTPEHSIDRINVNGDYEPGNVRWATLKEQRNNRRDSKP
jgi:hypothetical protein